MKCPICKSEKNEQVFEKLTKGFTSDSELIDENISNVICIECGNVFNESGARGETKNFYSNSYKLLDDSSEAEFRYFNQTESIGFSDLRFTTLTKNVEIPKTGKILDIGCGKGNFLLRFFKDFSNWSLYGVEISKNALKFAKEKLPNAILYEGFFDSNTFDTKFEIITALGVLEHLEDPSSFIQSVKSCLLENGLFFFDVPNFKLFPFDLYVYDHLSHFTSETLMNLLLQNELEIIKIIENKDKIPLFGIVKKAVGKKPLSNHYKILNKIVADHINFNNSLLNTYKKANQNYDKIGIFGLGMGALIGFQKSKLQIDKIECFFDENELLIGKEKMGKKIRSIEDMQKFQNIPTVFSLNPCYMDVVIKKLQKYHISYIAPENYQYYKNYF